MTFKALSYSAENTFRGKNYIQNNNGIEHCWYECKNNVHVHLYYELYEVNRTRAGRVRILPLIVNFTNTNRNTSPFILREILCHNIRRHLTVICDFFQYKVHKINSI